MERGEEGKVKHKRKKIKQKLNPSCMKSLQVSWPVAARLQGTNSPTAPVGSWRCAWLEWVRLCWLWRCHLLTPEFCGSTNDAGRKSLMKIHDADWLEIIKQRAGVWRMCAGCEGSDKCTSSKRFPLQEVQRLYNLLRVHTFTPKHTAKPRRQYKMLALHVFIHRWYVSYASYQSVYHMLG